MKAIIVAVAAAGLLSGCSNIRREELPGGVMLYGPAKGQRTFVDRRGVRHPIDPRKRLFESDLLKLGTTPADPEDARAVKHEVCGRVTDASQPSGC